MNAITDAFLARQIPVDEIAKALASSGLDEAYYSNGHLLRPLFLSRAQRERLNADLICLHEALTDLPARLFDGDVAAFAAAVGAVGPQIDAARAAAGQVTRLSRADLYTDATGFRLLELNVSGAVGGLENAQLNRAYLASPQFSAFAADHDLDYVDTLAELASTLREETGVTGGQPVVAIVDSPDSFPTLRAMLEQNAAALGQLDIDAFACHLGQVECRNGRVFAAGRPIDVIYRLFLVEELLQPDMERLMSPVLAAAARGEVAMFTPIGSELYGSKAALALLSDERHRDRFTAAELDVFDRILPWTRVVHPDLLAYAREHREQLVLKATTLHGGAGFAAGWLTAPDEWERRLAEAVGGPWVLQRRVVPAPELIPGPDGTLQPYVAVWGAFRTASGYAGTYVRASANPPDGVVSWLSGALSGACFHER
jgi:hypothetical protein